MLCEINKCTGCLACYNVCTSNAIELHTSEKGFVYPVINDSKCINCGVCSSVCEKVQSLDNNLNKNRVVYAAYTLNKKLRSISSSGGLFSEIAAYLLKNCYEIWGAGFSDEYCVKHIKIENIDELDKLRRSKYVQSDVGFCYSEIKEALENGKKVCFSGTPCQVNALKVVLGKEYENLFLIDLLCHGVCSPKIWNEYIIQKENQIGKIKDVNFRSKKWSWNFHSMLIKGHNGSYDGKQEIDEYYRLFLHDFILRENCFSCNYRTLYRAGDITLGDFWALEHKGKSVTSEKGHSMVLINSEKGNNVFNALRKNIFSFEATEDLALRNQALGKVQKPNDYEELWNEYKSGVTIKDLAEKFVPVRIRFINKVLYRFGRTPIFYFINFLWQIFCKLRYYKNRFIKLFRVLIQLFPFIKKRSSKNIFFLDIDKSRNLGDQAQSYFIKKWIYDNYSGCSLYIFTQEVLSLKKIFFYLFAKKFNIEKDIIIFQSGYNTQDLGGRCQEFHEEVLMRYPNARVLMMPQTIYFKNEFNKRRCSEVFNKATKMLFLSRDAVSHSMAEEMFPDCKKALFPDIVTTMIGKYKLNNKNRNGILFVIRDDSEKYFTDNEIKNLSIKLKNNLNIDVKISNTILNVNGNYLYKNIESFLQKQIMDYSQYKLIVTDKYHGTIFSLASNTPTLVLKTNDHKVSTGIKWFDSVIPDYIKFADNLDDAYKIALEMYQQEYSYKIDYDFSKIYYDKLKQLFEQ